VVVGARLTRRGRLVVTVSVVVVALLVAALLLLSRTPLGGAFGLGTAPPCTLDTGRNTVEWSSVQALTATTVAGVGTRIGASENGVAAAVHRALAVPRQSALSADAARTVYRRLPDVAKPGQDAVAVARALLGYRGPALTCVVPLTGTGDLAVQGIDRVGLTPRADTVRLAMRAVFGPQSLGGFAPGGVKSGHVKGSAHYEGRAIDVFFRPVTTAGTRHGWQQAIWAVAQASGLHVATVIFDRQIWSSDRSAQGWRTYRYPGGATQNPVLLHEDHVHVDVERGG
jgi:hypothetical protein